MWLEYNYEYELYHWGIKGQKWGVRRFQNKDGSLTAAGKERYSDGEGDNTNKSKNSSKIKVTHRDVLEKKYRDSGMSKEEAKAAANKRIKVEKAVAATAAITVAACATYYLKNKYIADRCDTILKSGTTFHNLDSTANPRPGEHLYVNYRQNDVNYFRGHFAVNKMRQTGQVFNHTLTTTEDIKIPSLNTRKNVFKQLYDSDQEFRETFNKHARLPAGLKSSSLTYKNMWAKFGDKNDPAFNTAKRKYFDALRQKGYEAIVDEWDTSKGVFRSDAPLILLNTSSKSFGEMSIKELSGRDILLSQANSRRYEPTRTMLTALGTPHTNHFKESGRHLTRYSNKDNRNKEYINKALNALTSKNSNFSADDLIKAEAKAMKGATLADTGKYMTKFKNMSYDQAAKLAKTKNTIVKTSEIVAESALFYGVPYAAITSASQSAYVRKYMADHPNTKLTYNEIKQKYNDQGKSTQK